MKLLLVFLLATVIIGLYSERLNSRTYSIIVATSLTTTVLYFGLRRFMA